MFIYMTHCVILKFAELFYIPVVLNISENWLCLHLENMRRQELLPGKYVKV